MGSGYPRGLCGSRLGQLSVGSFVFAFPWKRCPGDAICCGYGAGSEEVGREVKLKQETRDSEESCTNWGTGVGRQRERHTQVAF